jgi:hypothetical protein
MQTIHISWWNLENLFDVEDSTRRTEKLQRTMKNDLKGLTASVLDKKLSQLAAVINSLNNGNGPDLMGVCEVENRYVLEQLLAKLSRTTYSIIHADCKDDRGIDVAFIYDNTLLTADPNNIFYHCIMKRNATRDIVQVNYTIKASGKTLVAVGNHWPSRSGGELESEPYRMMAGETLAYYHERICEVLGDDVAIIAMGDFNDAPFNSSVINYALSVNSPEKILNATTNKYFHNLMWPLMKDGDGSIYFSGFDLIDQFMVSEGILQNAQGIKVKENTCCIEKPVMMVKDGKPVRFGLPKTAASYNPEGYSDHFPVSVKLEIN